MVSCHNIFICYACLICGCFLDLLSRSLSVPWPYWGAEVELQLVIPLKFLSSLTDFASGNISSMVGLIIQTRTGSSHTPYIHSSPLTIHGGSPSLSLLPTDSLKKQGQSYSKPSSGMYALRIYLSKSLYIVVKFSLRHYVWHGTCVQTRRQDKSMNGRLEWVYPWTESDVGWRRSEICLGKRSYSGFKQVWWIKRWVRRNDCWSAYSSPSFKFVNERILFMSILLAVVALIFPGIRFFFNIACYCGTK